ncbi:aminoacyl--tRNA ligase-related protein [Serratia liquefaciens]|uniref:aminoacyl--tRNA ligase-related protein n=1 Tax=Serratia liquefaciens TaxID=614 RepID=UPI0021826CCB|nr:aminoacyl--tRNA ligase-related protein [Serratia liquefaciens]CAI2518694.1 Proline--tRNA ligase [Serratia liquefaciens]
MKLTKQLFLEKYRPPKILQQHSTASLLNNGPFYQMVEKGIPLFLPIGNKILTSIEHICIKEAEHFDFNHIDMTQMVPTDILSLGESFHDGFLDQFVFLKGKMDRYHLLSTPEPLLLNFLKEGLKSYRQLPIKMMFSAKFYRQLSQVQGILKTREFRMLAGACLQEHSEENESAIELFNQYTLHLASLFSIPLECIYNQESKFKEYFYIHPDGDERFNDTPAMSLAMAYEYGKEKKVVARYCSHSNRNMNAQFVTYGLGLQRLFFVILDRYRDSKGFNLPKILRPFDIALIPQRDEDISSCFTFADCLKIPPDRVMIDDRNKIPITEKENFSDYLGIPQKLIIHRNDVLVKHRDSDTLLKEAFQLSAIKNEYHQNFNVKIDASV